MQLSELLPADRIHTRLIDRLAYAHDASIYRLIPETVVRPANEGEVARLLKYAHSRKTGVTFRAAGTSLSGQTVTTGIIAETIRDWTAHKVIDQGKAIKVKPGVVGDHVNRYLAPYGRKMGPDPASIKAARMGGIVSNNASGMASGIFLNSYHTLNAMRFVLANGSVYDTSIEADYDRFVKEDATLAQGLKDLRQEILASKTLKDKIEHKYRIKNTLGYSLNALLDYEHPLDIFAHLLVGAEGTLAFLSEITLNTVPDPQYKTAGLILFNSLTDTCRAIPFFKELGAEAVEMMDYNSLTTAKYLDEPPYDPASLKPGSAALLCEFQKDSIEEAREYAQKVVDGIGAYQGKLVSDFIEDEASRLKLWKVRKSLFTTVGSLRAPGTSVITEDLCFDVGKLDEVVTDLHGVFEKWNYDDAVIFGHAKDGNLHFVASIDLETPEGVKAYEGMLADIGELTVDKHDGSLKAEHGTGRNMAPYLEKEWGTELYEIMWRIKNLADPENILNPGVLLNRDRQVHIKSLKPMPLVHKEVDLCVECGFCEPVCPSREITLTPRNRIIIAREINHYKGQGDDKQHQLIADYDFEGTITCAADGLCETACPVNINTGSYMKYLRFEGHGNLSKSIAGWTVRHFAGIMNAMRPIMSLQKIARILGFQWLTSGLMRLINRWSKHSIHTWSPKLPPGAKHREKEIYGTGTPYVYYTSCINRSFSATDKKASLTDIIGEIAGLTGVQLIIPERVDETCCGTIYSSKGFKEAYLEMASKTVRMLYETSQEGKLPIVVDTTPCTYQFATMGEHLKDEEIKVLWSRLKFIDVIPFLNEIIDGQKIEPLNREVILHPTCSTQKLDQVNTMVELAQKCASTVHLPENYGCCAYAGDRGMLVPELTASATRPEAADVKAFPEAAKAYSSSRTCEIGMATATDRDYESIALLVRDWLTQST